MINKLLWYVDLVLLYLPSLQLMQSLAYVYNMFGPMEAKHSALIQAVTATLAVEA